MSAKLYASGATVAIEPRPLNSENGLVTSDKGYKLETLLLSQTPPEYSRKRQQPKHLQGLKRGNTSGWSKSASQTNTRFLMSIDMQKLSGIPYSVTLTIPALGDEVPNSLEFHNMLNDLFKRMIYRGNWLRVHWLIEFTAKLTPHVHMTVWVNESEPETPEIGEADLFSSTLFNWSQICQKRGLKISPKSQYVRRVDSQVWLEYLSKHGARGKANYQRARLPESWQKSSGRMWGKRGNWSEREQPIEVNFSISEFHTFRRLGRNLLLSKLRSQIKNVDNKLLNLPDDLVGEARKKELTMRKKSLVRSLSYAKNMLNCPDRKLSTVRPLQFWFPQETSLKLVEAVGYIYQEPQELTPRQKRILELTTKLCA